jgi:xanthine/uracil/vitamin C permease (AzgA family)
MRDNKLPRAKQAMVSDAIGTVVGAALGTSTVIPAFLIIVGTPFSYSIADGLALGFITYAIVKGFSGRAREISWLTYLLAIVLVV